MAEVLHDFAGPGGWDEGIRLLGSDVRVTGRELNEDAVATARAAGHSRVQCDVMRADPVVRVDGYIASPPCPTFSAAGSGAGRRDLPRLVRAAQQVARGAHPLDAVGSEPMDPRTALVLHPLRVVRESRPDWVVLEQVPGAGPVFDALGALMAEHWGYQVRCENVRAEEYGVPQTRTRRILVAVRSGSVPWPVKTHSRYHVRSPTRLDEGYPSWVSMAEVLGWGMTQRPYLTLCVGTAAGGADLQCLGGSGARATVRREMEEGRWVPKYMGDVVRANGTRRDLNRPAPTVTGAMDNGNFRWVNGSQSTRLSVTEAGVLQSFRPDYPWRGTRTSQFQRVGDAVPPLLARAVLAGVLR